MALNMNAALKIKASVDGLSQLGGLQKGLSGIEGQAGRTGGALGRLRGAAGGAVNALRMIVPAAGVAGLIAIGKKTLDAADAMSKMSQRTGVAVPELAKFQKAADLSDVSMEKVGKSLGLLSKGMVAAQANTGPAAEAFQKLGVRVTDANGKLRSSGDVMMEIAGRFQKMPDGAEKAALAMQLFGKSGMDLIPMLNMGSEAIGKLGTNMTQEFADKAAAFNDRITTMQARIGDLTTRLTIALLPAFESVIGLVEKLLDGFSNLPGPIQAVVGIVGGLVVALGLLAPVLTPVVIALKGLAGLKIAATIAGWAPVIMQAVGALGALGKILIGVFTGPVGWVALAVAAGVAIWQFRDQIGAAFAAIGKLITNASQAFYKTFVEPIIKWNQQIYDTTVRIFDRLAQALRAPFQAAANVVRGIVNQMLAGIGNAMNAVVSAINRLIQGANRALAQLRLPQIPTVPQVQVPQFAKGGIVKGPTLAMVGEGGEPEYIVPQSKASGFAANWMAGRRGAAAIPAFAEGGVVAPSAASINITTGPVMQQDGQRYVTLGDLESAMQQVVGTVLSNGRTSGGRRYAGIR